MFILIVLSSDFWNNLDPFLPHTNTFTCPPFCFRPTQGSIFCPCMSISCVLRLLGRVSELPGISKFAVSKSRDFFLFSSASAASCTAVSSLATHKLYLPCLIYVTYVPCICCALYPPCILSVVFFICCVLRLLFTVSAVSYICYIVYVRVLLILTMQCTVLVVSFIWYTCCLCLAAAVSCNCCVLCLPHLVSALSQLLFAWFVLLFCMIYTVICTVMQPL